MTSSYTASLRLEKQGDGDNSTTWGQRANTVFDLSDAAISGLASVAFTNVDVTLTANNGSADQSRNMFIKATGTLSGNVSMIVPLVSKFYVIWNATTGVHTFTVKGATGTGIVVPTGSKMLLMCDGTNVLTAITDLGTLNTALAIASGGTGASTAAGALTALGAVGKQSLWIPAGAIRPSTTGGCATVTTIATSANQPDIQSLDFDASTQEYAQFSIAMPKQWDEGTVTFQAIWSHAATTTNFGVVFDLQGVAQSDDDPIPAAYGTAVTTTDTGGTTDDLYVSPESAAITIAGTPQAEDVVHFRLSRVIGNGSDTMAIDARLLGIRLFMTNNTGNDA